MVLDRPGPHCPRIDRPKRRANPDQRQRRRGIPRSLGSPRPSTSLVTAPSGQRADLAEIGLAADMRSRACPDPSIIWTSEVCRSDSSERPPARRATVYTVRIFVAGRGAGKPAQGLDRAHFGRPCSWRTAGRRSDSSTALLCRLRAQLSTRTAISAPGPEVTSWEQSACHPRERRRPRVSAHRCTGQPLLVLGAPS